MPRCSPATVISPRTSSRKTWAGPGPAGPDQPAAGSPAIPGHDGDRPPSAPAPGPVEPPPPFTFTVRPGTFGGVEIQPLSVTLDHQVAVLRGDDQPAPLELTVYRPGTDTRAGGWDLTPDPERTRVHGSVAWYSVWGGLSVLRWEYTDGGWAALESASEPPLDERSLRELAEQVRFTAPYPVRLPYRLDYLPAALQPFNVGQDTRRAGEFHSTIQLESGGGDRQYVIDITLADGWTANPHWDWQPTTIAGRPARCADLIDGRRCAVDFGEVTVDIGWEDPEELERLVAGLHLAAWHDPDTWYELDTALP